MNPAPVTKRACVSVDPFPLGACLALLVALSAACASSGPPAPSYGSSGASDQDAAETSGRARQIEGKWSNEPLSWEKLRSLEAWLDGYGPGVNPELVPVAQLELAEGRLAYSQREAGQISSQALARRVGAAQNGFQQVLRNRLATPAARSRARRGLEALGQIASAGSGGTAGVIPRQSWGAAAARPSRLTRHTGGWTRITVHHSAELTSELGRSSPDEVRSHLRRMQGYHMDASGRGFGDIGYHYLIDPAGRVYEGRSMQWQGAHAGGNNNVDNIGICVLGNFVEESPTPASLAALTRLTEDLRAQNRIEKNRVFAHQELKVTECPGPGLVRWLTAYRGGSVGTGSKVARSGSAAGSSSGSSAPSRSGTIR